MKSTQNEHAKILKERDDAHSSELKQLDQLNIRRELESLK
jgi:hypothetical protein